MMLLIAANHTFRKFVDKVTDEREFYGGNVMNKREEWAVSIAIDVMSSLLSNGLQDEEIEFSIDELVKMKRKSEKARQKNKFVVQQKLSSIYR